MKSFLIALSTIMLAILASCSHGRSLVVLLPDADGLVGALQVTTTEGTIAVDEAYLSVAASRNKAPESPRLMSKQDIEVKFDHALNIEPSQRFRFVKKTFYCIKDSSELTQASKPALTVAIEQLIKTPPLEIFVVGHADRMGSERHNQHLSYNRALAIQTELVANNIKSNIILISFMGESRPLVYTPDEVKEPRNRRVEIVLKYAKSD
jgi:outer membrane protein OmpA-like peptidoglycan-associated protein